MKHIIALLLAVSTGFALTAQEKTKHHIVESGFSLGASKSFTYGIWSSFSFDKHQKVQLGFLGQLKKELNTDFLYSFALEAPKAAKTFYLDYVYCIKLDYANDIVLAAGPAIMIPQHKKYYATQPGASFYAGFNLWTKRKNTKQVRGGVRLGVGALQSRDLSCTYADFGILFKLNS